MKSSYVFLIIGGAVLASGLGVFAVSTVSVTKQLLEGASLFEDVTLEPGLSFVSVSKDLPAGRQLLLSIASEPAGVPLSVTITDSVGDTLASYDVTESPFTATVSTKTAGDINLQIRNAGTQSVTVNGALLNSPLNAEGTQDGATQNIVAYGIAILVGMALIVAGIVLLIIGAVKLFKDRKPESIPR